MESFLKKRNFVSGTVLVWRTHRLTKMMRMMKQVPWWLLCRSGYFLTHILFKTSSQIQRFLFLFVLELTLVQSKVQYECGHHTIMRRALDCQLGAIPSVGQRARLECYFSDFRWCEPVSHHPFIKIKYSRVHV